MHERVKIADRLAQMGLLSNANCKFCCVHTESREHLVFECGFVRKILTYVYEWLGVKNSRFHYFS